jgi:RND family efflux transporter MFP subunit
VNRLTDLVKTITYMVAIVGLMSLMSLTACGDAQSDAVNSKDEKTTIPVTLRAPIVKDAVRVLTITGNITADRQVTVFSAVPGRVVKLPIELGTAVRDSQVIAVIDHSTLDLQVQQARAGLATAKEQAANLATEYDRIKRLYRERGASRSQYDAVSTQKKAAEEGVKQARAGLGQTMEMREEADIRAPFSGVVGKRFVELGDMVGPGVPIAIIVKPSPLLAKVQIPERDLGLVHVGQPAHASVAAFTDTLFEGTVSRISPIINTMTRMAEIEIALPNRDRKLKPGMFSTVQIEVDRHPDVVMLPSSAIQQESRISDEDLSGNVTRVYFVYTKRGDTAHRADVTLGYTTADKVEITSGLTPSDTVVVRGQNLLQSGTLIRRAK